MSKKTKEIKEDEEDEETIYPSGYLGTIPQEIYWEWRTSCSELNVAKEKVFVKKLEHQIMLSNIEISKLRSELFSQKIKDFIVSVDIHSQELENSRKKIEASIGAPIKDCIINEVFQVIRDDPAPPSMGEAITK